ncbi:MAG: aminotransferase class IV [Parachlamydiales bacterium]
MSELFVLINGEPFNANDASLSVFNLGFQYGFGIFTTLRIEEGKVLNWDCHTARIREHCDFFSLSMPAYIETLLPKLISLNEAEKGVWKGKIIVSKNKDSTSLSLATLEPYKNSINPWKLASIPLPRQPILSKYKTLSYIEMIWLAEVALKNNVDEMLICNGDGTLLETSKSALCWIHQGKLFYPSFDLPLLRSTALTQIINSHEFKSISTIAALQEIPASASVFAINALQGVIPIQSIDSLMFNQDPVLHQRLLSCLGINRSSAILFVD